MRIGFVVVLMVGAMATAWAAASALRDTPDILAQADAAAIDINLTTAAIPPRAGQHPGSVFRLSSPEAATSCMVVKGAMLSPSYFQLNVNPGCEQVFRGLSDAKFWRERADGSVAFTDANDAAIAEFAAGDGVDYESFQPSSAMLSMWAE